MTFLFEILKAILYGITEGITAWLPLDASVHLKLLGFVIPPEVTENAAFPDVFFPVLELGALAGMMIVVLPGILPFLNETKKGRRNALHVWALIPCVSIVPVLLRLFAGGITEAIFRTVIIAAACIGTGVCLLLFDGPQRDPEIRSCGQVSGLHALLLGLFQIISLIPGVSMPAVYLIGGMVLGFTVRTAVEFSLYAAILPSLIACAAALGKASFPDSAAALTVLAAGGLCALVMSAVTVRTWLVHARDHDLRLFGLYRVVFGIALLAMFITGFIPSVFGV